MKDLGTRRIETERLILRRFTIDDAEGMYNSWATDSECNKFMNRTPHNNIEETKSLIQLWINEYENGSYNWVVELKNTNELIGRICTISVIKKHLTAELGYCYGSKYWGNGYATEALVAVLDYLLNECDVYLVEARHMSGNPASGRVMEKAGMHKDAVLRDRKFNECTHERNDSIIYSITKAEL